jgi:hypothetical protein
VTPAAPSLLRATIVVNVPDAVTPDGRPLEGRVFHAFDPDGYLVELLQAPGPAPPP